MNGPRLRWLLQVLPHKPTGAPSQILNSTLCHGNPGYRGEKSLEEEELRNELGKPLNAIQWVQVPPD